MTIQKKYTLLDLILIPLKTSPVLTSLKILEKIVSGLLPSLSVIVTAMFIDTALSIFTEGTDYSGIRLPLILLAVIIAYQYINNTLLTFITVKTKMKLNETFHTRIIEKKSRLEYKHIENNESWEIISRISKDPAGQITAGFDAIINIFSIGIHIVSMLVILFTQVWWAGIIILVFSVPLIYFSITTGKKTYEVSKETAKIERKANYLKGVLSNRENVDERYLFGFKDYVNEIWFGYYEKARKMRIEIQKKVFIQMNSASLITLLAMVIIIVVLIIPLKEKTISIGIFMALVTAVFKLVQAVARNLSAMTKTIANKREYIKDLNIFVELSEQEGALDEPAESKITFESLEFKNVSFTYPGTEREILHDCSFKLNKDTYYAFVGKNGVGKTTITKLITGLYTNYSGEILINGIELRKYELAELKALYAIIHQDFARYYISLKDNIKLGNVHGVPDDCINNEIKLIGLDKVVDELPDGLETYLGKIKENGVDLSGGEWQLVAIARALVSGAPISILDEPTSALDPMAESKLYDMFAKIAKGKSTIFITHRLGAARIADEILVIDNGKVVETGTHQFLMKANGLYSEMFESQKGWYV